MKQNIKKVFRIILSIPIAVILFLFDIIKLPVIIAFFIPLGVMLAIFDYLGNDKTAFSFLRKFIIEISLLGILLYCELMNINIDKKLNL